MDPLFPARKGIVLIALLLFVSGCAGLVKPEIARRTGVEARAEIGRIMLKNAEIPPYKGIGELGFFSDKGNWAIRGAWVAASGGRFRVEPLGLAGQPLAKLICDQDACYFLFSEDGCYKKRKSGEKSLEPLTGVAVDVDDLVLLLGGGVPVYPHDFAWVEPAESGWVLVLANRLGGIAEKIIFSDSGVDRVEIYGWRGLRYRAEIQAVRVVDGYRVPGVLQIKNDQEAGIRILVDRSWMNVTLQDDVFVPTLPETDGCD